MTHVRVAVALALIALLPTFAAGAVATLDDSNMRSAVTMWTEDNANAVKTYGDIKGAVNVCAFVARPTALRPDVAGERPATTHHIKRLGFHHHPGVPTSAHRTWRCGLPVSSHAFRPGMWHADAIGQAGACWC